MYSQIEGANTQIEEHMKLIRKVAKGQKFGSLLLFGAYGKGEGGWFGGEPVNDYDLMVIDDVDLKDKLASHSFPFVVDVHSADTSEITPTQQWYEIRYGSIKLAGKKPKIPDFKAYDIPFSDAVNSLDRRTVSMLVARHEMFKERPDNFKVFTQIAKMIIALGDAMLIKRGQFSPSYRTRALMLGLDGIAPLYTTAVMHKVLGEPQLNNDEAWGLWNQTKELFRQYCAQNNIRTQLGEILINFDERINEEVLEQLLVDLGAKKWLK